MKKNKLILLQLFTAFVLICTSVYAAVTTTINLSVSNTSVYKGDKVSVTLSLSGVESGKKVESIEGYINYNTNIIEAINVDSIQKNEDNTVTIGNETLNVEDLTNATVNDLTSSSAYVAFNGSPSNENNSKIVIDFKDGITADTNLLTIDFKVKENATEGEIKGAISYSMFVITAGSEQSEEITKNVNLTVKAVSNNDENENKNDDTNTNENVENKADNNTKNENKNTNSNTNSNSSNTPNNNTNKNTNTNNTNTNKTTNTNSNTNKSNSATNNATDNTVSGTLPSTGARVIIVPMIILAILAYISYNRYIKYKDI